MHYEKEKNSLFSKKKSWPVLFKEKFWEKLAKFHVAHLSFLNQKGFTSNNIPCT